jgi:hypothetical protein
MNARRGSHASFGTVAYFDSCGISNHSGDNYFQNDELSQHENGINLLTEQQISMLMYSGEW